MYSDDQIVKKHTQHYILWYNLLIAALNWLFKSHTDLEDEDPAANTVLEFLTKLDISY